MPVLVDIEAFLVTARTGGFSAAAREIGTAPSVITKRVSRLEDEIGTRLFYRSTRKLSLTAEGEHLRPQLQLAMSELDSAISGTKSRGEGLSGLIRVKSPTTVGSMYVGPAIAAFQIEHPGVAVDLVLVDRLMNPLEEGLDIAIGALPQSFASVEDTTLCPYDRILVGSPDYLRQRGRPQEPSDLTDHDCLVLMPVGHSWVFSGPGGAVGVEVRAKFTVNDSRLLMSGAIAGLGIAVLPVFLAQAAVADGRLERVMRDFPTNPLWMKATVPRHKAHRPEVSALVRHLKEHFATPPWGETEA